MANYIELWQERRLEITETGITGTRAFVYVTGGSENLPSIGASWAVTKPSSQTFSNCKCRRLSYAMYWYDRDAGVDRQKIVAYYATQNKAGGAGYILPDEDERRFQAGGQTLAIADPSANWTWLSDSAGVTQDIYISTALGSFTIQKKLTSDSSKKTWQQGPMLTNIGRINASEFEDFRQGSVLFDSVSGGTQQDEDGDKIWVFELAFNWRLIRDTTGTVFNDDWQYIWRENASGSGDGKWDRPLDGNAEQLYAYGDFFALL